jgi:hypothetical protein
MKPTLNEQLARMQKLAGIITENQINENTKHAELKSLEDILLKNGYRFEGDDKGFSGKATYQKKINDLNTYEISLFKNYENSPVRILYFVGDDYTFTNGKKLNRGQADIRYKSINDAEKDLEGVSQIKENTTYTNEGEGAYKDSKVSFGKFKNVEYYKVDNELYLVVTNSDNFKEIENSMDFGDRDYLKDKEKSFLNNTVDKLADEMSNYLTSIGVKNEVGDSPIGYGQEIDNLIVVINPNDLSKLNNTQMSEGEGAYEYEKGKAAGKKIEKKIEKEKMTKSKLKEQIKEMILAELNEDSTEDVNEPGALNNLYSPLGEVEAEEDEYEAEDDSSAESLYKMFVKYDLDNDRRYYDAEDFMMAYPNLSKEEAEKLEDMLQNPLDEANSNKVMLNGKEVDVNSIEVEGGSYNDYSDVYISFAKFKDGTDLNNDEREELENLVDMGELANDSLSEAKKDKEEVEDITVDDTEVVDAPESDMMAGESAEVSGIQANLQAAYAEAKALGDEKLITQIANTITYFTKAHILDTAPINENMFPMLKRILR